MSLSWLRGTSRTATSGKGSCSTFAGGLLTQVELDPKAGMFCVRGDRAVLGQLREELEEYLDDPERIARLITEAESSGFHFDD